LFSCSFLLWKKNQHFLEIDQPEQDLPMAGMLVKGSRKCEKLTYEGCQVLWSGGKS
jgi:hypothetical protein